MTFPIAFTHTFFSELSKNIYIYIYIYTQFLQNVSKPPVPGIEPGVTRPESNALPPSTRDFDEIVSILLQYKV